MAICFCLQEQQRNHICLHGPSTAGLVIPLSVAGRAEERQC